ncbi:MAG: hypothetical protein J4F35_23165, partial [Candidatus Latescibacteria bacterium]|nr:hypothetical protein [Candidatus Latescibacterota bacterium]
MEAIRLRVPNQPLGVGPSASEQGRGQGTRRRVTPATVGAAARRQQSGWLGTLNTASVLVVLSCLLSPAYSQPDYGTR